MRPSGGNGDEMDMFRRLGDREVEDLLSGIAPGEDGDLEDLVALIGELRAAGSLEPVSESLAERHVALAAEVARTFVGTSQTVQQPHRPVPRLRERRRKLVLATLLSSLVGKIVVGSVAVAAATGGAAAAGVLPDPVQEVVADAASHIGIDLPSPADAHDGALDEAGETARQHCDEEHPEEAVDCDVLEEIFGNDPTAVPGEEGRDFGEGVAGAADQTAEVANETGGDAGGNPTGHGAPEGAHAGQP